MNAAEIREHARQAAALLPPITQAQLDQLRLILRPSTRQGAAPRLGRAA